MLLTRLPLSIATSFDLHVLGVPPAYVLSQDQTLQVERSSNTEWQTGEYNVGICLLVWNNTGKLVLIPNKPLRGKF